MASEPTQGATASPGDRAVAGCEIDDVFLVFSQCQVDRQFNQSAVQSEEGAALQKVAIDSSILIQTRTLLPPNDGQVFILRYYVRGEVIYPAPGKSLDESNVVKEDVLAHLIHEFAVDYRCPKEFLDDKKAVQAFGKNALFHVWGFWREAVIADSGRFRLPRLIIPMMRVKSPFTVSAEPDLRAAPAEQS